MTARRCILVALCICAGGCARPPRTVDRLRHAPLHTLDEDELDVYLKWLDGREPDVLKRVARLARQNIGQRYRIFLLGEGPFERHDPDPLYCLAASDCVTFVEQTYAMALSDGWAPFFRTLQRIRYRGGEIGFSTRNHFTEADWNVNNRWLFEDVTASLVPGAVVPMRVPTDRAAFFARKGIQTETPVEVVETTYVPREKLAEVAAHLRDGDVVEIVRGTPETPYVGHMGLILHDPGGGVTILHSGAPAVREESLREYIERRRNVIGMKFLRMVSEPGGSG